MAGLVDISIKNFKDILNDQSKLKPYLNKKCKVTHKSDGIKIVLVFNKRGEWEVHYKDKVINKETFEGFGDNEHKNLASSSGYAQYIYIFNHLKNIKTTSIPKGTKFFCEFIMRKATLTRSYKETGALVLLSVEDNWNDAETEKYAKILKLRVPKVLAQGKFGTDILPRIEEFMNAESVFGGVEEGIVLTFDNGEKFKLLQPDQHDIEKRRAIKASFYESPEYYIKINKSIKNLPKLDKITWKYIRDNIKLPKSEKLTHLQQVEDALERTLAYKEIVDKGVGLILGKFRVFTKEHENLVKKALAEKDIKKVVICMVSSKDTQFSQAMRMKMLKSFKDGFKTSKDIEIIEHSSGNLYSIFRKIGVEPLKLYCGTDRVESYRKMLAHLFTEVIETKRDANAISATKALANIENKAEWDKVVSTSLKDMYDEIKSFYKGK